MTEKEICAYLKERRKQLQITQLQMEEATGIKREMLSRVENGKVSPQLSTILKIAKELGAVVELK